MPKEKFSVGEKVEMKCDHLVNGKIVNGWIEGVIVQADYRMTAVKFDIDVYSSNGWEIPDRILWCAHGSSNIRRKGKSL